MDDAAIEAGLHADADALLTADDAAMQQRVRARLFAGAAPQRIGPFEVRGRLGSGGMGEVFSAVDPRLRRSVALKVLRSGADHNGERQRHRLRREARALAQLHHPNIVRVFDVGTHEGKLYMAMEHIRGVSLRAFVRREDPRWTEVIRLFAQAGDALHAAHHAGLLHRDFKPDNVLVDERGDARVLDFGLALLFREGRSDSDPDANAGPTVVDPDESLKTQGLIGTPGYMAPEQYLGHAPDPATDQFAFCAALYEALCRRPPLPQGSLRAAGEATVRGAIAPPRRGVAPAFVLRAVMRGLAVQPADRWPSIAALLQALRRGASARRRGQWVAGALGATLVVTTLTLAASADSDIACPTAAQVQRRLLPPARAATIATRFEAQGDYGGPLWAQLQPRVERYAAALAEQRVATCGAALQPGPASDLRAACLRDRERRFEALLHVLEVADDAAVSRAHTAVAALAPVSSCADGTGGGESDVSPQAEAIRADLAAAEARIRSGDFTDTDAALQALVDRARGHDDPRLLSSALTVRADGLVAAGRLVLAQRVLEEAYFEAHRGSVDAVALEAAASLMRVHAQRGDGLEEGLAWARHGRARLGPDTPAADRARLLSEEAVLLRELGRLPAAAELAREALRVLERASADPTRRAMAHEALATVLSDAGEYADAREHYATALHTFEASLGPQHPALASTVANMGTVLQRAGQHAEAEAHYRRALEVRRAHHRPDHPSIVGVMVNVGSVLSAQGRVAEAEAAYREVIAIVGDGPLASHPRYAWALNNLATIVAARGDMDDARALLGHASAIFERAYGALHPSVAGTVNNLGMLLLSQGDPGAAADAFTRALAIYREVLGDAHPEVANVTGNLARVHLELRQPARALPLAQEALRAELAALGGDHLQTAGSMVLLGEVLAALGRADEAREQWERAAKVLDAQLPETAPERLELAALLESE